MLKLLTTTLAVAAFAGAAFAAGPDLGKPAPDFAAADTTGKPVKLSDFKGKLVILEWSNHQCP